MSYHRSTLRDRKICYWITGDSQPAVPLDSSTKGLELSVGWEAGIGMEG